ncbi:MULTISPECIES: hypothetical protein [Exiguobacterium]|uniref:Uncharacterized protein n=1 Tax=Exiguobacterium acetylicum TaxID=41170 RepID=A0ABX8GFH9_EXIAC|nr:MULTISPECIES: hypothetical protein [Exiguobacterium]QWB31815.1 hypothetical protein KKI46_16925 [Exiguobacterium acetylicum]
MLKNLYSTFLFLLLKSLLTAITASAILTVIISLVPEPENDFYSIVVDTFFLYIVYSFPLIFIAGFIADVLIKRILNLFLSTDKFIFFKFLIYIVYALLLSFVLLMIFNDDDSFNFLLFLKSFLTVGSTACIFYLMSTLIYRFKKL